MAADFETAEAAAAAEADVPEMALPINHPYSSTAASTTTTSTSAAPYQLAMADGSRHSIGGATAGEATAGAGDASSCNSSTSARTSDSTTAGTSNTAR